MCVACVSHAKARITFLCSQREGEGVFHSQRTCELGTGGSKARLDAEIVQSQERPVRVEFAPGVVCQTSFPGLRSFTPLSPKYRPHARPSRPRTSMLPNHAVKKNGADFRGLREQCQLQVSTWVAGGLPPCCQSALLFFSFFFFFAEPSMGSSQAREPSKNKKLSSVSGRKTGTSSLSLAVSLSLSLSLARSPSLSASLSLSLSPNCYRIQITCFRTFF